jgi:transcription factor-like protein
MHGAALKQLNQVLSDATRHTRDEVIVAVAALAISELLVPSGPNNYLSHMVGLERLVDLQDPVSFWSSKSSGFCKGVRFMILFASLRLGRPSILARPDWKKAMRADSSYEQLREQDLFDVLADCTVLLAERDAVVSAWDADAVKARDQRDEIQQRARCLLTHLHEWRSCWDADGLKNDSHDGPASPSGAKESQLECNEDVDRYLVTVATIATIPAAVMLMLYNVALMYVLQVLTPLPREESAPRNTSHQPEPAGRYHADEFLAAREACRCVQYYMSVRRRLDASASPIVHWAVATAWTRLRSDDSVEAVWMRELLTGRGRQVVAEGLWTTYIWVNSLPD